MTKEEIKELIIETIKENLTIEIKKGFDYGYGGDTIHVLDVSLVVDNEVICKETVWLD